MCFSCLCMFFFALNYVMFLKCLALLTGVVLTSKHHIPCMSCLIQCDYIFPALNWLIKYSFVLRADTPAAKYYMHNFWFSELIS